MKTIVHLLAVVLTLLALGPIMIDLFQAGAALGFGVKFNNDEAIVPIFKALGFLCFFGFPAIILLSISNAFLDKE